MHEDRACEEREDSMKRVFIHAYTAGNLGDDLFIRILCERYQNVKFILLADASYKKRFKDIKNLKVYSVTDRIVRLTDRMFLKLGHSVKGFWKLLLRISFATVHIGGSIFVQHEEDFSVAYSLDYEIFQRSKRIFVIGANFGPYTDDRYYHCYSKLFKKYNGIVFRDQHSYKLFQGYSNVSFAPDVVFSYKIKDNIQKKHQVLISVIDMKHRQGRFGISHYDGLYKNFLVELTQHYLALGYKVKFISFCKYQGDEEAIQEILMQLKDLNESQIALCKYDINLQECIDSFAESEIVIGTRFHSIILGWLMGKKVLPIVYDSKTKHTLEDNGCTFYIELEALEKSITNIDQIIEKLKLASNINTDILVKESVGQFKYLDKVFKS